MALALALAGGCDGGGGGSEGPGAPPGRFVAVTADPVDEASLEDLCETSATAGDARAFALPALDGPAPAAASGWRWVNVWATWCRPCIEEMPMLVEWTSRLGREGKNVELLFLSADSTAEAVAEFRREHTDVPESARVADATALPEWVTRVGLDSGATLPIHVFVDPAGRTRCARTGAVGEDDYGAVARLLGE